MNRATTIKENYEFRRMYAKGKSGVSSCLVVYYRPNRRDRNRLGVTVSAKLGHAVVRNRIRRRLREIFRLSQPQMRKGYDIYLDMSIPMTVAALGGEIQVPTLTGNVKYNVPEGTQTATTFRLKEQGIPRLNSSGKGDMLVRVNVQIPKRLSDEQKELVRKLADSLGDKVSDTKAVKRDIINKVTDKNLRRGVGIPPSFLCGAFFKRGQYVIILW